MTEPTDPLDALAAPVEPVAPRPEFARDLRARLAAALGLDARVDEPAPSDLPTVALPERSRTMSTTTPSTSPAPVTSTASGGPGAASHQVLTPYLAVHDAAAALAFYEQAFGAVVVVRIVGDDGKLGHSEVSVGPARFFLADEYPDLGVVGPLALGGTAVTLHLEVDDVDGAFARAVAAGATSLSAPADQPHGARHGTLVDPFGHRWMLSQQIEQLGLRELGDRMGEAGFTVEAGTGPALTGPPGSGGVWAAVNARDAGAMIRFMVDVLGFREQLVVPGERPDEVAHSQLEWPGGGIVQVATAHREGNVFSERPVGGQSLYLITADPQPVFRRCVAAGVEVLSAPVEPDYDPGGSVFSIRDHEGNLWSVGTYAGG